MEKKDCLRNDPHKKQQSGINKQSDIEFFPENYLPLINISSPK